MSKRWKFNILFVFIGMLFGYLYWYVIGCDGNCSIKSVWYHMTLYGGALGYLVGSGLYDWIEHRNNKDANQL